MVVSELAILPLTAKNELSSEFLALLERFQATRDAWVLKDDPSLPADRMARGTSMYRQLEDPTVLLLTAQWESPEAHSRWIASAENASVMADLSPHLDTQGERAVVFFHLEGPVFTSLRPDERSLLEAPVMSVGRFSVGNEKRDEFQRTFDETKDVVEDVARPYPLRGAWRIEKDEREAGRDEFVMYCGWASVDEHMSSGQHPRYAAFQALQKLVSSADIRHYQRII
ncbi:hypothetical protein VD0004_g6156 [Verticillium dahliae]|nr:hypothetical protein VD0004_g6156 [Verticillium dahliae]PNH71607.1 hypothetical protein VD0001_g5919 [Verticillium dahliae]